MKLLQRNRDRIIMWSMIVVIIITLWMIVLTNNPYRIDNTTAVETLLVPTPTSME